MWTMLTHICLLQDLTREHAQLKRQLEAQENCAEAAANEDAGNLLAVIAERDTAEINLKVSKRFL